MEKKDLRIIYMGTPEFAVAPLKALVESNFNVVAVVTMPDKLAGRGMKMQSSPVKIYAQEQKIPVLQPEKLKDEVFLQALSSWKADLQIVVAFRMLPVVVWNMPPMGTFNLHASLLPQYRGAAPIHWAVMNGETETGVSTFFLQDKIDTGDLLLQEKIDIGPDDTTGIVHDKLMYLGAQVVCQTVDALLAGTVQPIPQPAGEVKLAPKLFKDNTRIVWTRSSAELHDFIRGLSPFPTAWTEMLGKNGSVTGVKVFEAGAEKAEHSLKPGTLVVEGKSALKVAVPDGFIRLLRFQLAGRKALNSDEFLRGFPEIADYWLM
ncbi:MAG TPA: methionyl-tRNA formyltransferase [Bacteroidales bacterium]|nr:methionyl-tRNA formyltransferase [Bacteroidales bacterium]